MGVAIACMLRTTHSWLICAPMGCIARKPGMNRSTPASSLSLAAMRQQLAAGAMVSFELAGGLGAVRAFLGKVRLFSLAESLGGIESLVAHPASMTHAAMDPEARRRAGIADSLLRLSIGIEEGDDLLQDLAAALDAAGDASAA